MMRAQGPTPICVLLFNTCHLPSPKCMQSGSHNCTCTQAAAVNGANVVHIMPVLARATVTMLGAHFLRPSYSSSLRGVGGVPGVKGLFVKPSALDPMSEPCISISRADREVPQDVFEARGTRTLRCGPSNPPKQNSLSVP